MNQKIVRRFEVHAAESGLLDRIDQLLRKAEDPRRGILLEVLERVQRPPLLQVRLRGSTTAVASVMETIQGAGVQILRDAVEPEDAPLDRTYPDPEPLLRMNADLRAPDAASALVLSAYTGPVVRVAIVDTGVMSGHRDLDGRLLPAEPMARGARDGAAANTSDADGHGTMLAGTILAAADFHPAVRLIPIKFFDAGDTPRAAEAARAIDLAVRSEAHVICLSWQLGLDPDGEAGRAIEAACHQKRLVVIAAGNDGSDNDEYPSIPSRYVSHCQDCRSRTITVMATDRYDEKAWFSNYGDENVDMAAPGVRIVTIRPYLADAAETQEGQSQRYCRYHGTSAAAANVAGAAALLKSVDFSLTAEDLKKHLVGSVAKRPGLRCKSGGRLDVGKALGPVTSGAV